MHLPMHLLGLVEKLKGCRCEVTALLERGDMGLVEIYFLKCNKVVLQQYAIL